MHLLNTVVFAVVFLHCTLSMLLVTHKSRHCNKIHCKTKQLPCCYTSIAAQNYHTNLEQLPLHHLNLLSNLSSSWQVALLVPVEWLVEQMRQHCLMVLLLHCAHPPSQ